MESNCICSLFVIVFCLQIRGHRAGVNCTTSLFTWPLGDGIDSYEVRTNSSIGKHLKIKYSNGPTFLGYNAVEFNASDKSYIEFPVHDFAAKPMDYAISLYLYVESDGVFLHYKSDDYGASTGLIESIKLEMISGSVKATVVTLKSEAHATLSTGFVNNTWFPMMYMRDYSKQKITLAGSDGKVELDATGTSINGLDTSFPGTLRFGGSMDGESYFSGRVACVQMMPCKDPEINGSHTSECAKAMPSTTTTEPAPLRLAVTASSLDKCKRYNLVSKNSSFPAAEAIATFPIGNSLKYCSEKCSTHGSCWSFVFMPVDGSCWLGPSSPGIVADTGSDLYEVVPYI